MRPLVLNAAIDKQIRELVLYADGHRICRDRIVASMGNPEKAIGTDPKLCIEIPFGFRCVFSIEEHGDGWFRHLSVSIGGAKGYCPHPMSVHMLMQPFGFKHPLSWCVEEGLTYTEQGDHPAINVMEPLDPNAQPSHVVVNE